MDEPISTARTHVACDPTVISTALEVGGAQTVRPAVATR